LFLLAIPLFTAKLIFTAVVLREIIRREGIPIMDDHSHLRATVNEDGAAILDTRRRTISTLNPTGAYVWQALERGENIETIAENLAHETGEPVDTVKQDTREFIEALRKECLVAS
jgi:hypothetical protein